MRVVSVPVWLASFACLCIWNPGAALGLYISAVTLLGTRHFGGMGNPLDRPDNPALAILLLSIFFLNPGAPVSRGYKRIAGAALVFLVYGVVQTAYLGSLDPATFAWFMRMFGIPFLLWIGLRKLEFGSRELAGLLAVMLLLALLMSLMSIVQALGWHGLLFPPWTQRPEINPTLGSPRVGGVLMQSEWNGMALSLLLCLMLLGLRRARGPGRLTFGVTGALCLAGVFLTYTRAAWLGTLLGLPFLLLAATFSAPGGTRALGRLLVGVGLVVAVATLVAFPSQLAEQRVSDAGPVFFRLNLWLAGLSMVRDNPIIGVGFAEFSRSAAEYARELGALGGVTVSIDEFAVIHNTFLNVLVELGLVGLSLYAFVLFGIVISTARDYFRRSAADLGLWVAGFSIVYLVQIQFVNAHDPTANTLFFGTLGLLSATAVGGARATPS